MQYNNPYSAYSNLPVQPTAPMYQNPYNMNMQQPMQMQMPVQMQMPMQAMQTQQNSATQQANQSEALNNGGFIVVPNEEAVKSYAVAPGNFVTFKIENQPIVIEKSMSRSQFASPHYERYKLLKEDMNGDISSEEKTTTAPPSSDDNYKLDLGEIKNAINDVKSQVDSIKSMIRGMSGKPNNNEQRNRKDGGDKS